MAQTLSRSFTFITFHRVSKKVLDRTLIGAIGFSALGDLLLIFDGRSFLFWDC